MVDNLAAVEELNQGTVCTSRGVLPDSVDVVFFFAIAWSAQDPLMSRRCRRVSEHCRRSRSPSRRRPCTRDGAPGVLVRAHGRPKGCDVEAVTRIQATARGRHERGRHERRLCPMKPFVPARTHVELWAPHQVRTDVDDPVAEYGYRSRSRQDRFFDPPHDARGAARVRDREVILVYTGDSPAPRHMADPRVVARAFGALERGVFVIWHASVNKAHPLNDAQRGAHWGLCNNVHYDGRYWFHGTTRLTQARAEAVVGGTPNPYLVQCLVGYSARRVCQRMTQDPAMPCAKLFSADYSRPGDQRSHPATLLLYKALGFVRPPSLTHYVRPDDAPPIGALHARLLERMRAGLPAVPPPTADG